MSWLPSDYQVGTLEVGAQLEEFKYSTLTGTHKRVSKLLISHMQGNGNIDFIDLDKCH